MWEDNCPRKIGFQDFVRKYSTLFPERVEQYAKDHWAMTQNLVNYGQNIANRVYTHPSMLTLFLLNVGVWKNPHGQEMQKTIFNIARNDIKTVESVFTKALGIYNNLIKNEEKVPEKFDRSFVNSFGELRGFGKKTGSRKMVSAILRFLDSTKYGTVDYRNWVILSNTDHEFLKEPFLKPLASTIKESKHIEIDTRKYLEYLREIRKLADKCSVETADVDMALFAYSDEIIPLSRGFRLLLMKNRSKEKALKMMEVIQEVAESVESLGFPGHANILLSRVEPLATKGDYRGIFHYCRSAISGKPHVDEMIEERGGKSLRRAFPKIEEIYHDC